MKLELKNVHVKYGKRNVLRDVSLSFWHPLTYLIGLNGSGKTTLLRAILGQVMYEGRILLEGADLRTLPAKAKAQRIAVVDQQFSVPFQLSVTDYVLMGRYPHLGFMAGYQARDREIAAAQLTRLGLTEFADRNLDELSGGELQKVRIARALCQEAAFLLLDEPAQNLDPKNKDMVYALLEQLASEGVFILCSSHDDRPMLHAQARLLGLKDGEVVYDEMGGKGEEEGKKIRQTVYGY